MARSDAGFTLLELLVSLSLLGLLTMLMAGSLHFGVQVWARSDGALSQVNKLRMAEVMLRSDLSHAYPLWNAKGTKAAIAFDGTAQHISYLVPSTATPGALEYVDLHVGHEDNKVQLTRMTRLELAPNPSLQTTILLRGLSAATFSYFGKAADNEASLWQDDWRAKARLPALIRIRLTFRDGHGAEWIVAPKVAADVGCVFDALTKSCQGR